jgi:flagellar biogenesis protein FliO
MIPHRQLLSGRRKAALVPLMLALAPAALAEPTNTLNLHADLPDVGLSALRTLAALLIVLSLFLGGVWFYRNTQRMAWRKTGLPKLAILESRALGNRYALYVVGYEQQRLLIGGSPAGLTLLSHLPAAAAPPQEGVVPPPQPASFTHCFRQLLKGPFGPKTEGTRL